MYDAEQRQRLSNNIAAALQGVPKEIKLRQVSLFAKCDPAYGTGVSKALKLNAPRCQLRLRMVGGSRIGYS